MTVAVACMSMNVADAIADRLEGLGIRHVFGVGGANIEDLFAAVQRRRPRLRAVLCKHEHGAGTAADGYARAGGGLGVVMTTSGGGAMNLVHALAEARASEVPVLALVGEPPTEHQGRGAFQDTSGANGAVDAAEVFRGVAAFVARLEDPAELPGLLERALAATASPRPGPAVILIAKDRQRAEVTAPLVRDAAPPPLGQLPAVDPAKVARAAALLRGHRVMVVAGPEVRRGAARDALARLIDGLQAQVAVAPDARDAFDNRDPRFRGVAGAMGHAAVTLALAQAEAVLLVGTRMPLLARMGLEPLLAGKPVVSLGVQGTFVQGRELVEIPGPLASLVGSLADRVGAPTRSPAPPPRTPIEAADRGAAPEAGALPVAAVMSALALRLPDGATVVVDAGNTGAAAVHHLPAPPGGRWLLAMGMAGMGYAFGAAIGAALATGKRCVVVAGDGAFFMHGFEIHTAVQHGLPITYLLLNNRAHGMCVVRERLLLHEESGYNRFGPSRLGAGLAAMFPDLPAWDCEDLVSLRAALNRAFAQPGPAVVSAVLPEVEVPPFVAFRQVPGGGGRP